MVSTLFTNRIGGVSRAPYSSNNLAFHVGDDSQSVAKNRSLNSMLALRTQFMNQVHGNTIALVEGIAVQEPIADGLVSTEPGLALGVLVADCIPLLLWSGEIIAAVHVGRKGLMNGVAVNAVKVMMSLGAEGIEGVMGPSICGKCYEVGEDVYEEVSEKFPSARAMTARKTLSLDLPAALLQELGELNVMVTPSQECTFENHNYFSYRRDGVTGRQAGLIWRS